MIATAPVPAHSLTERFAFAVELVLRGFCLSLPRSRVAAPLALATWNRLRRLVARFSALVAAVEAGRFSSERGTKVAKARTRPLPPEGRVGGQVRAIPSPQAYGWLLALAPELNTRIGRAQIETLLGDPALLALLAQAPQAGRILRPLCHMLRIERPDCLRLPPRPRRAAAPTHPKPAPLARQPRPPKPSWMRWPPSPPLPGMARRPADGTRRRTGNGPPPAERAPGPIASKPCCGPGSAR